MHQVRESHLRQLLPPSMRQLLAYLTYEPRTSLLLVIKEGIGPEMDDARTHSPNFYQLSTAILSSSPLAHSIGTAIALISVHFVAARAVF
jgi:hypothetical protein